MDMVPIEIKSGNGLRPIVVRFDTEGGDTMENENPIIELTSVRAMIYVPENAVEGELTFTVYQDGELSKVTQTMDVKELREAIRNAEEGYIDEDDVFTLTDKGRQWLDEMRNAQDSGWPESAGYDGYDG